MELKIPAGASTTLLPESKTVFSYQKKFAESLRARINLQKPSQKRVTRSRSQSKEQAQHFGSSEELTMNPKSTSDWTTSPNQTQKVTSQKQSTNELHRLFKTKLILRAWRHTLRQRRPPPARRPIKNVASFCAQPVSIVFCARYSEFCKCKECVKRRKAAQLGYSE